MDRSAAVALSSMAIYFALDVLSGADRMYISWAPNILPIDDCVVKTRLDFRNGA